MLAQTVQVNKTPKGEITPRHAEFTYEFPESASEALEKYGEDLTLRLINDSITLLIQSPARKALESAPSGLTQEEYSELVGKKMEGFQVNVKRGKGVGGAKMSAFQKTVNDLADPTKRDEIIARFRSIGIHLEPIVTTPQEATEEVPAIQRRR